MGTNATLDSLETINMLLDLGFDLDRVRAVVDGGTIRWDDLTIEELERIANSGPDEIGDTGLSMEDLTDEELERIALGFPPEEVVRERPSFQ